MRTLRLIVVAVLALSGLLVAAPTASADDTECIGGPVGGGEQDPPIPPTPTTGTFDNIIVPTGAVCILLGAQVRGNVTAMPGSELVIESGTTIAGNVEVGQGAFAVAVAFSEPPLPVTIGGNMLGQPGSQLFIDEGATVVGSVEVKEGASTGAFSSTIRGNYKCDNCFFEDVILTTVGGSVEIVGSDDGDFVQDSTIGGNLHVTSSTGGDFLFAFNGLTIGGSLIFEKSEGVADISFNTIAGNLQIYENNLEFAFCPPEVPEDECPIVANGHFNDNIVGGNMQVYKNRGPIEIIGNQIVQNLQCFENDPPPVGIGNTYRKAQGQCRVLPPPPPPPDPEV